MLNPTPSFPLHLTQYLRHPFPGTHYSPPNPNKPTSTKRQKEDQRLSRVVKTPLPPSSKVNEANNLQNIKKKESGPLQWPWRPHQEIIVTTSSPLPWMPNFTSARYHKSHDINPLNYHSLSSFLLNPSSKCNAKLVASPSLHFTKCMDSHQSYFYPLMLEPQE